MTVSSHELRAIFKNLVDKICIILQIQFRKSCLRCISLKPFKVKFMELSERLLIVRETETTTLRILENISYLGSGVRALLGR